MINFKQKYFNAATKTAKRFWEKGSKFREGLSDPRTALSVASLSVAGAGYRMNSQNIKDNKKAREEAHKAALEAGKTNKELLRTLGELNENLKKKKLISQTTVNNSYYTTPQPQQQQKRKFLGLFSEGSQRQYSIESGSYKGGKRTPGQGSIAVGAVGGAAAGAIVVGLSGNTVASTTLGALFGGGFGAFTTWMANIADKSIFNAGLSEKANSYQLVQEIEGLYAPRVEDSESTVSRTEVDKTGSTTVTKKIPAKVHIQPKGLVYEIDGDPKKYSVSVLYSGNVLVLFINNVARNQMSVLNRILDKYCHSYKNADYTSTLIGKDIYVVELCVVNGTESEVVKKIIDAGIKVNIVTGQKFGVKNYSTGSDVLDETFKVGTIGSVVGGIAGALALKGPKPSDFEWKKAGLKGMTTGLLIGAALGLIYGGIKAWNKSANRNSTVNDRLLPQVLEILKKQGFKEGKNYTRDPHMADLMKTRVCIMISKYSSDLQLVINCADDPKLKDVSTSMIKNLPNTSVVSREEKNRFNNISITKISDGSADAGLISGMAEYYIRSGFPVYFVEVG